MNNNLLKLFIEGILNIQCQDIKVLNPDLSRDHVEDKDMILAELKCLHIRKKR